MLTQVSSVEICKAQNSTQTYLSQSISVRPVSIPPHLTPRLKAQ